MYQRGNVLTEAVIIIPILLTLLFGSLVYMACWVKKSEIELAMLNAFRETTIAEEGECLEVARENIDQNLGDSILIEGERFGNDGLFLEFTVNFSPYLGTISQVKKSFVGKIESPIGCS